MNRACVVALVAVAAIAVPMAGSASTMLTKDQAYRTAKRCLIKKAGARFVGRRGDGGGFANLKRGSTFWTYKTLLGQVASVTVYFAGQPPPSAVTKRQVKACLTKGI